MYFNTGTNAFSTIKYTNIILKVLSILHILPKKKNQNNNSRSNLKELPNIAEDLTSIRDLDQLLEIKHSTGYTGISMVNRIQFPYCIILESVGTVCSHTQSIHRFAFISLQS